MDNIDEMGTFGMVSVPPEKCAEQSLWNGSANVQRAGQK